MQPLTNITSARDRALESFFELFVESKGKPVSFEGKTLHLSDTLPTDGISRFRIVFEKAKDFPRQGVFVSVPHRAKGSFIVNGKTINKGFASWHEIGSQPIEFEAKIESGEFIVFNIWDNGGVLDYGHNGAAMLVEPFQGGRRYRCNDRFQNTEFAAVVFRIEFLTN
jgi:hypothetical protein